jgi:acetyl esterase
MRLPLLSRIKVRGGRPVVRWLHGQSWLRRRLLSGRDADLAKGLDHDVAWMLALAERAGEDELARGSPRKARRKMAESIRLVEDMPAGAVAVTDRTVPGSAGPIPARVYEPDGLPRPSPGLVFVHGGGWVTGDLDTHDTLCRRMALLGKVRVVSIAPRMAPEHPFPAPVDDTLAAFRFVAKNAGAFGIDPARLGIGGDSAGGNLSAVVGLDTRTDEVKPALTVLIYPSVDATCSQPSHRELAHGYFLTKESIDWYLGHYAPPALRRDPRVSPLHTEDLRGAPRALIAIAGFDPLRDEAERYAERLGEAGTAVEVLRSPSLPHGFTLMTAIVPAALRATEAIARRTGELLAG